MTVRGSQARLGVAVNQAQPPALEGGKRARIGIVNTKTPRADAKVRTITRGIPPGALARRSRTTPAPMVRRNRSAAQTADPIVRVRMFVVHHADKKRFSLRLSPLEHHLSCNPMALCS